MFSPAVHVGGLKNEHVLNGGRVTAIVIDIDAKHLPEGFAPREVVAGIHAQFPRAWGLYSNGVSLF